MKRILDELSLLMKSDKRFQNNHIYTIDEIEYFEHKYDLELPEKYKNSLMEIGTFEYKYDDYGSVFKFIKLEDIESWSHEVYPPSENQFPEILLIANSTSGEEFGIIKGKEKLYVFDPECPCNLWFEEQMKEYEFEEWLSLLSESKMETLW